ncbi:hypothetical protein TNCV_596051, partial [Trichonephila clavipes]
LVCSLTLGGYSNEERLVPITTKRTSLNDTVSVVLVREGNYPGLQN